MADADNNRKGTAMSDAQQQGKWQKPTRAEMKENARVGARYLAGGLAGGMLISATFGGIYDSVVNGRQQHQIEHLQREMRDLQQHQNQRKG